MSRKTYAGNQVDVGFDPAVCRHAAECVNGLPAVFDTQRRPWITPDSADGDTLVETVRRCPTGALTIEADRRPMARWTRA